MRNLTAFLTIFLVTIVALGIEALAAIGFERQIGNLNNSLTSKMLPLVATCGLIYACFLMVTGNAEGKSKAMMVLIGSVIALMAPSIIDFLAGSL